MLSQSSFAQPLTDVGVIRMAPAHRAAQTSANDGRKYVDPGERQVEKRTSDGADEYSDADTSPPACANDGTQERGESRGSGDGQKEPLNDGSERGVTIEHPEARENHVASRHHDREHACHHDA